MEKKIRWIIAGTLVLGLAVGGCRGLTNPSNPNDEEESEEEGEES